LVLVTHYLIDRRSLRRQAPFKPHQGRHNLRRKMPPIVDILARAGTVSSDSQTKKSHSQANLLFTPTMGSIDLLDWRAYDRAISAGYRHAIEKLECLDKSVLQGQRAPVRLSGIDLPYQLRKYEQQSKGAAVA
jgi:NTE family protein